MNFSVQNREDFIQQSKAEEFDLLVIGGGITGAGIALDAAIHGLKVVLIEKADFASGTSSRSTKLIHGGLRYLKQLEFKLVKDVGSERAIVYRNALNIVRPEKMLLPLTADGSLGKQSSSLGLWIYDLLAGVKKQEQRRMLTKEATLAEEPLLNSRSLTGGGLYYEYRTDDARLVMALAKTAYREGAVLLNYCEQKSFVYDQNSKAIGAIVKDVFSGQEWTIKAKAIVNATGPGVDVVRKKDNSLFGKRLQLTKGVHIVFPYQKLPLKQAAYFDVSDGRMIFAIPRDGVTYVGTTDTVYTQDIDRPLASAEDVTYLLSATNAMFPTLNLTLEDITSSWAGLRPLIYQDGKSPSELSRKDEIITSESGVISIAGGKLTGYRLMAEKIISLVQAKLDHHQNKSISTKTKVLSGCEFENEMAYQDFTSSLIKNGLSVTWSKKWANRYGTRSTEIFDLYQSILLKESDQEKALLLAEVNYVIHHEMTCKLSDFIVRRSGMLYFEIELLKKHLLSIAEEMQGIMQWDDTRTKEEIKDALLLINEVTNFQ
jgi:glycerol-3-phosphate dehydrogenase